MKKEQVKELQRLLRDSDIPITHLAKQFNCTAATVHNINKGATHHDPAIDYPIRKESYHAATDTNKLGFLYKYKSQYKPSVMAAILELNYQTVLKYYNEPTQYPYQYDAAIERRKDVLDIMAQPREELFHQYGDINVTIEDAVYFKFLYTIQKDEALIVAAYHNWLELEFPIQDYPIAATIEDIRKYLEWDGTKSKLIWFIRGIGNGKIKSVGNNTIRYTDFEMRRLRRYMSEEDFQIALDLFAYNTNKTIF